MPYDPRIARAISRYAAQPSEATLTAAAEAVTLGGQCVPVTASALFAIWRSSLSGKLMAKLFDRRQPESGLLALLRLKIRELQGLGPGRPLGPRWQHGRFSGAPVQVQCDASFRGDTAGFAIWVPSRRISVMLKASAGSPTLAEALSATQALKTAKALGLRQVHLLTDCSHIPEALNRPVVPATVMALRHAAQTLDAVLVEKVPRPFLHHVDRLAYAALHLRDDLSGRR